MPSTDSPRPVCGATIWIRLRHGTDLASARDLEAHGLSAGRAATFNASGEFWATTDVAAADMFAQANPAGGMPARFEFDIPLDVVLALLSGHAPQAFRHAPDTYEFLPRSYPVLNREMRNRQVISPVP